MQFGLSMFLTDETITPVALGRAAEDAGFESLFVPEHTHIPASRESAWPGGDELPREYSHTLDPFVALSAIAATTERLRDRHRHRADRRARPDHPRPRGRHARPPLRRALRARDRRGLEPRGDAQPRHRPGDALSRHARARAGDARDLDAATRRPSTASSSTSIASGRGPSPCRARCRCGSAAPGRACSTASSSTATAGFRTCATSTSSRRASPSCSGRAAEAGRERIPVTYFGLRDADDEKLEKMAAAGVDRVLLMLPPRRRRRDPAAPGALRGARRAPPLMDEARSRARLSAARVGHLATVRPDGRPHVVACCFALQGDRLWTAVDAKPKATPAAAAPGQRARPPVGEPARRPLRGGLGRAVVGARRRRRRRARRRRGARGGPGRAGRQVPPVHGGARRAGAVIAIEVERWRGWSAR